MSPHYYRGLIGALLALPALWPALFPLRVGANLYLQ